VDARKGLLRLGIKDVDLDLLSRELGRGGIAVGNAAQ
jgi:hypothetical protein